MLSFFLLFFFFPSYSVGASILGTKTKWTCAVFIYCPVGAVLGVSRQILTSFSTWRRVLEVLGWIKLAMK